MHQKIKILASHLIITGIIFVASGCNIKTGYSQAVIPCSDDWQGTTAQNYHGPEIVRLAWGSIPERFTSNERFQELKDAGITHHFHYYYSNRSEVQKALDAAHSVGVKMIITCPELSNDTENTVKLFMNHPDLEGYFVKDEPQDDESLINVGILADRIRLIDKNHYCYLNLRPRNKTNTISRIEYSKFLDLYSKYYKPEIVSFDHYAIITEHGTRKTSIRPEWYSNFETVASFSRNIGKPFWAFAMAVEHLTPSSIYPEPVIEHLRLQVYSALAYGAQAIQYFTYWTPLTDNSNLDDGKEHYFKASIMPDGTKTNIYDLVKTVNEEIKNLSFIFSGSDVKWVRHVGIDSQEDITSMGEELNSLPVQLSDANSGFLFALHEKGDSRYLVVVNYLLESNNKLSVAPGRNVKRVLKSGKKIKAEKEIYLKPGDAVIYSWEK
ncbi:MAG: beta-galactosidase [Bacteroidales bacterium]|nr:beta-galactosidase [Bacteroidales bacterium]